MGERGRRTGGATGNSRRISQIRTGRESSRCGQEHVGLAVCWFRYGILASRLLGPIEAGIWLPFLRQDQ